MALVIKKSNEDTLKYIPVLERDEETPAIFEVRRIPQREFAKLEDKLARVYNDQSIGLSTATFNYGVVKLGLVSWENINDEYGRPITPEKTKEGVFKDDYINMIPQQILNELAEVIASITRDPESIDIFRDVGSPEAVAEQRELANSVPDEESEEAPPEEATEKPKRSRKKAS